MQMKTDITLATLVGRLNSGRNLTADTSLAEGISVPGGMRITANLNVRGVISSIRATPLPLPERLLKTLGKKSYSSYWNYQNRPVSLHGQTTRT